MTPRLSANKWVRLSLFGDIVIEAGLSSCEGLAASSAMRILQGTVGQMLRIVLPCAQFRETV